MPLINQVSVTNVSTGAVWNTSNGFATVIGPPEYVILVNAVPPGEPPQGFIGMNFHYVVRGRQVSTGQPYVSPGLGYEPHRSEPMVVALGIPKG
jgi:hypothetical protein